MKMSDSQVIRKAKQINNLLYRIQQIISEIENSDHPNAELIGERLRDHCISYESAELHAHEYLMKPENYMTLHGHALYHKNSWNVKFHNKVSRVSEAEED